MDGSTIAVDPTYLTYAEYESWLDGYGIGGRRTGRLYHDEAIADPR